MNLKNTKNEAAVNLIISQGMLLNKQRKYQDAIRCYDKAIKLNKDDPVIYR